MRISQDWPQVLIVYAGALDGHLAALYGSAKEHFIAGSREIGSGWAKGIGGNSFAYRV